MKAKEAETGKKYLTSKGEPVTVVEKKDDKVVIHIGSIDKKIEVPGDYELNPFDAKKVSAESKKLAKAHGNGKKPKGGSKRDGNSLAAIIDPYLLSGGKTVKEIAEILAKKAGPLAKGKDLPANVRARMVSYTRKGWRVEKDAKKQVKVVQKKG
jgi:hypothetical protein